MFLITIKSISDTTSNTLVAEINGKVIESDFRISALRDKFIIEMLYEFDCAVEKHVRKPSISVACIQDYLDENR